MSIKELLALGAVGSTLLKNEYWAGGVLDVPQQFHCAPASTFPTGCCCLESIGNVKHVDNCIRLEGTKNIVI